MNENEVRNEVQRLTELCEQIMASAHKHLAYARDCVEVVDRALAKLRPIAEQVNVNVSVGPLADTRNRLHRLLQ